MKIQGLRFPLYYIWHVLYKFVSLSGAKIEADTNIFTDIFIANLIRLNPSIEDLNVQAVLDELKALLEANCQLANRHDFLLPFLMNGQITVS